MTPPQVMGYEGQLVIGGVSMPALAGMSGGTDENYIDHAPIGNRASALWAEGMIQPVIQVPNFSVRDTTTELLSSQFLNYFGLRSNDSANDTNVIGSDIIFCDGADAYKLVNPKADTFSMSTSKGESLNMSCSFVGCDWVSVSTPSINGFHNDLPPLVFKQVTFGGVLAAIPWSFGMTFSNNHHPRTPLDGTRGPAAWGAGMPTGSLNIQCAARSAISDGAASVIIGGANISRTINLTYIRCSNPRKRGPVPIGEVMRTYNYEMKTTDPRTLPLLSFT